MKSSRHKATKSRLNRNFRVKFYIKPNPRISKLISSLKLSILNPDLSKSIKKKVRRRLKDSLIFEEKNYKVFSVKYQKFIYFSLGVDVSKHLGYIINLWKEISLENGTTDALRLFKQLMDIYNKISLSQDFESPEFLSLNSRGEPKILGPLLELSKGTFNERRAGLSCIQIIKLVRSWDDSFTTETISKSWIIPKDDLNDRIEIGNYFNKAIKVFGDNHYGVDLHKLRRCYIETLEEMFPEKEIQKRFIRLRKLSSIYVSARGGPNGPSLLTWVLDHASMSGLQHKTRLFESIQLISNMTDNKMLKLILKNFEDDPYEWSNSKSPKLKPINSRLSIKEEPWAKRRVFAICDAISQSALKGLHRLMFKWFEAQLEDGTLNQDRVSEIVREWTMEEGNGPDSADLSAATDSAPVEIQSEIVKKLVGGVYAKHWKIICSDREFQLPNSSENFIRYERGQPMGLLSSWAMLATWNHVMCRTSMKYSGIEYDPNNPSYVVIGDDVVLKDERLFPIYKVMVSGLQGVGISPTKGYHRINFNGKNPIIDEFGNSKPMIIAEVAKRIFCDGYEYTVVPPDEVKTSLEDHSQFTELVKSLKMRQYPVDTHSIPTIHALSKLSRDSKKALVLATIPNPEAPIRVTSSDLETTLKDIIWFQPNYDHKLFEKLMIKNLKELLIPTLNSVLGELNHWITVSLTGGEIKVKAWRYESEAQGLVIKLAADHVMKLLDTSLSEKAEREIFPEGQPLQWRPFKKYISSFQTIFELDLLLKRERLDSIKKEKRKVFTNTLVAKVVKLVVSDLSKEI